MTAKTAAAFFQVISPPLEKGGILDGQEKDYPL